MSWYRDYAPYVSVAQRRAQAAREVAKRKKQGQTITPVQMEGSKIASTFWGQAWCQNLESYSDFSNRLPRGRSYVRNGSVVHLMIKKGQITALVSGSSLYEIKIDITGYEKTKWKSLKAQCTGKIGSLVELLQGKLSKAVMELVTHRDHGLFPKPKEIKMECSCPDYAGMCKHIAAVMYGIGHRLDSSPELLFILRAVDHLELIDQAIPKTPKKAQRTSTTIAPADLGAIFDIELDDMPPPPAVKSQRKKAPLKKVKAVKKAVPARKLKAV